MTENVFIKKIVYSAIVVILYGAFVFSLYSELSFGVFILSILPVMAIAWLYGVWGGAVAGILFLPLNAFLMSIMAGASIYIVFESPASILGSFSIVIIGIVMGSIRDLYLRLQQALSQLKDSEEKFRDLFDNANDLVAQRQHDQERINSLLTDTVETNEKLKNMDKVKDEFLSIVTHDLKSPLVSVLGYSDMMLGGMAGKLSEKQRSYLEIIKKQSRRLQEMIDTILDYTRMEFGKTAVTKSEMPINVLLMEVLEEIKPQADQKGIIIEADLPKEDMTVSLDKGMINRVIANLLTNAIKYTPEKGQVEVSLKKEASGAVITFKDSGIGIAKENIPKLFEKFFVVDKTGVREKRSLGLGLPIAKHFVELHGGSIKAESQGEGKGSVFTVTI